MAIYNAYLGVAPKPKVCSKNKTYPEVAGWSRVRGFEVGERARVEVHGVAVAGSRSLRRGREVEPSSRSTSSEVEDRANVASS
ncbi:hypothetical protein CRG98_033849 [Punica granatum]|uniref:Uncharacterized protein n=1 Tax=Punica granatum TaxID=22663 RepID=A0A2I0IQK6_PUNGR|nr:hypothetical protein CRG98_033849 [Punica granatum]